MTVLLWCLPPFMKVMKFAVNCMDFYRRFLHVIRFPLRLLFPPQNPKNFIFEHFFSFLALLTQKEKFFRVYIFLCVKCNKLNIYECVWHITRSTLHSYIVMIKGRLMISGWCESIFFKILFLMILLMVVGYCYDISVVVDVLVGILKFIGWRELFSH